ncbi:DUF1127 domain-containing protein [Aquibium sp. LZ166]|uniref:DUF1127 domain-containing protein n=1 Tax=Aquibium pacificus TaxID=3153579 RepID=A0ABV3SKF9_9HYPH
MTTLELVRACRRSPVSRASAALLAVGSAIAGTVLNGLAALDRQAELRRAERELAAMPDHMLKDIGISRGAIHNRVHGLPD